MSAVARDKVEQVCCFCSRRRQRLRGGLGLLLLVLFVLILFVVVVGVSVELCLGHLPHEGVVGGCVAVPAPLAAPWPSSSTSWPPVKVSAWSSWPSSPRSSPPSSTMKASARSNAFQKSLCRAPKDEKMDGKKKRRKKNGSQCSTHNVETLRKTLINSEHKVRASFAYSNTNYTSE